MKSTNQKPNKNKDQLPSKGKTFYKAPIVVFGLDKISDTEIKFLKELNDIFIGKIMIPNHMMQDGYILTDETKRTYNSKDLTVSNETPSSLYKKDK